MAWETWIDLTQALKRLHGSSNASDLDEGAARDLIGAMRDGGRGELELAAAFVLMC